jgi:hypothetical protein
MVSRTDLNTLVRMLESSAAIIDHYAIKPREQDKARLMRRMAKKLRKKLLV